MRYEVKNAPFPVLICKLGAGESVECRKGAMSWMTAAIKPETSLGGGLTGALGSAAGFRDKYSARGGDGEIAFASGIPGDILCFDTASKAIAAHKSAYLANTAGVNRDIFFRKKSGAGLFDGEDFIMEKFSGGGMVFLEIGGSCVEYELAAGQSMYISTGYLAAMEETCTIDIGNAKGVGNELFGGGEMFGTIVTGPGRIWLRTMPANILAGAVRPFIT